MQGRKPKPTNLKILNGNPGKRPLNENEPKPKQGVKCPVWLHKDAKKEWKRIAPELERLGMLTLVDMVAFAGYCESYAQWKECVEFVHKHGTTYPVKDEDGRIKMIRPFPQVSQANQHLANIRAFCSEFGFTPSSRGRIEVDKDETSENPMAKILKGGRPGRGQ